MLEKGNPVQFFQSQSIGRVKLGHGGVMGYGVVIQTCEVQFTCKM